MSRSRTPKISPIGEMPSVVNNDRVPVAISGRSLELLWCRYDIQTVMPISFRQVRSDEIDAAHAAYMEVYDWLNAKGVRQWLHPLPKEVFAQRQHHGQLFALQAEDCLAAVVTLAFETSDYWPEAVGQNRHWWIKSLAVARRWQGAGFGQRIMAGGETFIQGTGATEVYLDCVDVGFLPAYYAGLGYGVLGSKEITYPSGNSFPMVLMRKILTNP